MWYHTDDCAKIYHCSSYIYLLSCLALELYIIIYGPVVAPGYGKYMVDGMNDSDKQMLKIATEKLLNPELFRDYPKF